VFVKISHIFNITLQTILNRKESIIYYEYSVRLPCSRKESDEGCAKAHGYIIVMLFTIVRQSFGPLPISGRPISLYHVRASNEICCTNGCSANYGL